MLFIPAGIDTVLEVYPLDSDGRPRQADASPTVTVLDSAGGSVVASTSVTNDTVSTTLVQGAAPGDTQVVVSSATGITPGRCYALGTATTDTVEEIKVTGVAGTVIAVAQPLCYPHASATTVKGHGIRYTLLGATFATAARDYRARFSWLLSTVAQRPIDVAFAVSLHSLTSSLTPRRLQEFDGNLLGKVGGSLAFLEGAISQSLTRLHAEMATHWLPWCLRGRTDVYERAHACAALVHVYASTGETDQRDYYTRQYESALALVSVSSNVDRDESGSIASYERGTSSVRLSRG